MTDARFFLLLHVLKLFLVKAIDSSIKQFSQFYLVSSFYRVLIDRHILEAAITRIFPKFSNNENVPLSPKFVSRKEKSNEIYGEAPGDQ